MRNSKELKTEVRNPLQVLKEKLENSFDWKGIKVSRKGVIRVSKDLIEKYDLGKSNGIDFVDTEKGVKIAIVPITEHKPLLFSSKKLFKSKIKNEDGTVSVIDKPSIKGIQKNLLLAQSIFTYSIELFSIDFSELNEVIFNIKEEPIDLSGYTLFTKKPYLVNQVFDFEIIKK